MLWLERVKDNFPRACQEFRAELQSIAGFRVSPEHSWMATSFILAE